MLQTGFTRSDAARFTGEPASHFGHFFDEALQQAEMLFQLATGLDAMPEEPELHAVLAKKAVLGMLEALYEGQQNRDVKFGAFKTETIGSYSYAVAENQIKSGQRTGVFWFDKAVDELSTDATVQAHAVSVFDRPGDMVTVNDRTYLTGPADFNHTDPNGYF